MLSKIAPGKADRSKVAADERGVPGTIPGHNAADESERSWIQRVTSQDGDWIQLLFRSYIETFRRFVRSHFVVGGHDNGIYTYDLTSIFWNEDIDLYSDITKELGSILICDLWTGWGYFNWNSVCFDCSLIVLV